MKQIHIDCPKVVGKATMAYCDKSWEMYWFYRTTIRVIRKSLITYEENI